MYIYISLTMFIAALFIIARPGNNLGALQRIDKENVEHLYNGVPFSGKINDILKFAGKLIELGKTKTNNKNKTHHE